MQGDDAQPLNTTVLQLKISTIDSDPNQCRKSFEDIDDLAENILANGVLQPLVVKTSTEAGRWTIVSGERRWRAAGQAGLKTLPCLVLARRYDEKKYGLVENIKRAAIKQIDLCCYVQGLAFEGRSAKELMDMLGKRSRAGITKMLKVAELTNHLVARQIVAYDVLAELLEVHGLNILYALALLGESASPEFAFATLQQIEDAGLRELTGLIWPAISGPPRRPPMPRLLP